VIEAQAFQYCYALSSICVPSSTERIGKSGFSQCRTLATLTFAADSHLSWIEEDGFAGCKALWHISLPSELRELHPAALDPQIREISVNEGNTAFKMNGHLLMDFDGISVKRCFGEVMEVMIPRSVESLDQACFAHCETISSVIFESGSRLSRIRKHAFYGCLFLSTICIPSSVERLGAGCFCGCWSLSMVTLEFGSRLSRVGRDVFRSCRSLESIVVPLSRPGIFPEYQARLNVFAD
jgi:hypothetical protein